MIRVRCHNHGCGEGLVEITPEKFKALITLLGLLGPHDTAHAVIHYDCEGTTPLEDLENPGRSLNSTAVKVSAASTLKELFPEHES